MKRCLFVLVAALMVATACQSTPKEDPKGDDAAKHTAATASERDQRPPSECSFVYDPSATKLTWTAFKLSERAPVAGTFNSIEVSGTEPASDAAAVFKTARFEITTASVFSDNPERDPKLRESFFGVLKSGTKISGRVVQLEDGKARIAITLGGVEKEIDFTYEETPEGSLTATGKIDLADFDGLDAVKALNKVCSELHTGADGKSKLWPDVNIHIESQLRKDCK